MLSREDRILSEILVSRGLVARERIEACAKTYGGSGASLADALVDSGELQPSDAEQAAEEARSLEESLAPEFPTGKMLGEFRLLRELGRGGMGIVYEAEQEALGRRVALKVLPGGAALDERLAIRFLREARAAGRLSHPGIVSVYTSGRTEGVLYFAMELIEGRTLADLIAAGPLEAREAARITGKIARALDHAHVAGLVHRDVKPENVLLSAEGEAKIADFGLVLEASAGALTLSRHVLGTPSFIAPEQAKGESVDARSDIYGLGAVLYATLCGSPPFAGEVPSLVIARVLTGRPRELLSIRPELPRRLVAICERAMARDPAARYASAAEMAEDLEAFLEQPSGTEEPQRSKARRGQVIVLALAAGAALAAWFFLPRLPAGGSSAPATAAVPHAEFQPLLLTPGPKASPALSHDGKSLVYSSNVDGNWDIYRMDLPSGAPENLTPDSPTDDMSPALSPDGHWLAFASWRLGSQAIYLMDLSSRAVRQLVEQPASGLVWSADGREILFCDRPFAGAGTSSMASKIFALEVSSGRIRALTGIYGFQLARSAKGSIAFVVPGGGGTDLWSLPGAGGDALQVTGDASIEWSPVWSLDATQIFFGREHAGVGGLFRIAVDAAGHALREAEQVSTVIFPAPFYLTRAADDRAMALIAMKHDGRLYRLSLSPAGESVEQVFAFPNRFLAADSPQPSPDGQRIVFTAATSQEDLAIGGADGSDPRFLTSDVFEDRTPRWSPDNSRIAFRSDRGGQMEIWTLRPDGSDLVQVTALGGVSTAPVWSPDGARLACTAEGRGAFLVPAAPTREPTALEALAPLEDGSAFEPSSWSADGTLLAGSSGGILLYSLAERSYRRLTDYGTHPVWLDSRRLAFTTDRELHLLDIRSGETRVLFSFAPAKVSPSMAAAPDGRSLFVSLSISSEEIWGVEIKE